MSYETLKSETVYQGRVFEIHRDQVRYPDGRLVNLDIVAHRGAVTLIPVDEDGRIWFVRQYRHAAKKMLLELPAGVMDEGEGPETSAGRELREEIGMAAGKLEKIGEFYLAPGYSTEFMHVYLAWDLTSSPLPGDEDEAIEVEKIPFQQVLEMATKGQIQDAKSLSALLLASDRLAKLAGAK